ncbi:hypothetical protein ScPMuIL_014398 [Solemya velum]
MISPARKRHTTQRELNAWLDRNKLKAFRRNFVLAGIDNLDTVVYLEVSQNREFHMLPKDKLEHIQHCINQLRNSHVLKRWLKERQLSSDEYFSRLQHHKIDSLNSLAAISEDVLQEVTGNDLKMNDYLKIKEGIAELLETDFHMDTMKQLNFLRSNSFNFKGSAVALSAVIVSLITGIIMLLTYNLWGQARTIPTAKTAIFDFFTGKYPAPQYCTVQWDWTEPQPVGKTMTFSIKFFQKNGKPYPVSNADNLLVEILHHGVKVAAVMEVGGTEANTVNVARVSFTVHRAGEYQISVMIGGRHIKGSPFKKQFDAGPIDASKTGFMNFSSTVVCIAGSSHPLTIETRDAFGNLAAYRADQNNYFRIRVRESGSNNKYVPATQIFYDPTHKQLTMHIRMERVGCYQAVVSYGDSKLKNGEFNILVISADDAACVHKNMAKKSQIWYEARLVAYNHEFLDKAKKVFIYISPKQLTVKEFYLKIIGKKLYTYRLCPSTKFYFNGFNNQYEAPVFTIDDGAQPPVVLAAKDRSIIAATFTNFLLKNIGGSETFQDKQTFFNHEVRHLHSKRNHENVSIKIDRSRLLYTSYKATKNFDISEWCKNFEVTFLGEEGQDWGGLKREWFEVLCTELFDPNGSKLFMRFSDSSQGLVHPSCHRSQDLKLKYFEFAGKIVGKCLYESALGGSYRQLVKARFSRSFLAQLIGLRVHYKYFETDDPELYKTKICFIENNNIDDMDLTFSEEEYSTSGQLVKVVDLLPNGSKLAVTDKNKLRYLDILSQYRLVSLVREEVEYFLKGLNELIPDNLLSMFDENELELLMCGTGNYSISDFKLHHSVCGTTPTFNKVLDWFWTVVASFTEEQMAKLLQFTTGCSQLPPGGFMELNPKFQLTAAPTFNTLPTAHTCFNQLCLPDYDSMEQLHKLLLIAINEGNQGFGMA